MRATRLRHAPRWQRIVTFALSAGVAAAGLVVPGTAAAQITLGQVSPGVPTSCSNAFDFLQVSSAGAPYRAPATGTITSWSHRSQVGANQSVTLKVFRRVGDSADYQLVARDGPRPIPANTLNSFTATSIPIKAGDVLGITGAGGGANIGCQFPQPGSTAGFHTPVLADGATGTFTSSAGNALNLSAVLEPSNAFTLDALKLNKRKGNVELRLTMPNDGVITVSGPGVKAGPANKTILSGPARIGVAAGGKKRAVLKRKGKVRLRFTVSYTPTGGAPNVVGGSVKLKLRPPR